MFNVMLVPVFQSALFKKKAQESHTWIQNLIDQRIFHKLRMLYVSGLLLQWFHVSTKFNFSLESKQINKRK